MNLTNRQPFQKAKEITPELQGEDPAYLAKVRQLPCVICESFGLPQLSATQAHHVFHGRFSGKRTPDRMAIPLCEGCHQGLRDTSKLAIHQNKRAWAERYGEDHEYTAQTQDRILGDRP